ncbi:hypothetical protein K438DRAFT_1971098 [Mycena galopus ATCC 62051]|nr:hypothetical protein K438DRAFT_1971098 [Mycena galopus ATCC 62051]
MFSSIWRAGLAILCIINSVQARSVPVRRDADCATQCQPMQSSIASSETQGIVVLCTPAVANEYQTCLGCEVAISLIPQPAAQAVADFSSCSSAGHPINSITVTSINPTDAPPPVTSTTPAPTPTPALTPTTPASVTSGATVGAASTATTPVPGSISASNAPSSDVQSAVSTPSVNPTSASASLPEPSAPPVSFRPATVPTSASAGSPAGSVSLVSAPSAVPSILSNATERNSGGRGLANTALVLGIVSVWLW